MEIKSKIKNLLRLTEQPLITKVAPHQFQYTAYSQEGEDIVLQRIFDDKQTGFYVDIGAHHPFRYSNTFKFYQKGWRGINVDATPGSMLLFNSERPGDINVETGISFHEAVLTYYIFNDTALNTFSKEEAIKKNGVHNFYIVEEKEIKTRTVTNLLNEFLPANTPIDFMSIDVEGLDLEVLQSNDWNRYKPFYILIEELCNDIETIIANSKVYAFMKSKGYYLYARTYNTSFYKLNVAG